MAVTTTTRLGITRWSAESDSPTRTQFDADHGQIESLTAIDTTGTFASRPAPGVRGRYYFATDQGLVYRDDGAAWWLVGSPPSQSGDVTTAAFSDTAALGSSGRFADAQHRHGMPANPVVAHTALPDPHSQYALDTDLINSPSRYTRQFMLMGA